MKRFIYIIFFACLSTKAEETRSFELRTAPLAFYAKWITLDVSFFKNDRLSFGPSYISYGDQLKDAGVLPTYYGSAVGMNGIWALDTLFGNSWYVSSHAYYEDYRAKVHDMPLGYNEFRRGLRINGVFGYRQLSGSFLTMFGLGLETRAHEVEMVGNGISTDETRINSGLHAEFKVGWMF